ncbi:hypothetical protein ACFFSY_01175 [Paenibacillus aurantiacus]|uniref:Uncharacterized protein n=1 Tax=Paenibacillus aurantiacus TaxID=1936118 RepID=A0ABV5KH48_9BACL
MKVKLSVVLILFAALFSVWYLVPKPYETTLEGAYYQLGNDTVFENVKIHLDGKLQNHWNGTRTFKGSVSFEGKGIPKIPEDQTELLLYYQGGNFSPIFSGYKVNGGIAVPMIYHFGMLYTNDRFTQFSLTLFSGEPRTWLPSNGFVIAAPAQTREEALRISQKLMKKFDISITK